MPERWIFVRNTLSTLSEPELEINMVYQKIFVLTVDNVIKEFTLTCLMH